MLRVCLRQRERLSEFFKSREVGGTLHTNGLRETEASQHDPRTNPILHRLSSASELRSVIG